LWDGKGNVVGATSPTMENIVLCLKTNYDSSSIDDFGLRQRDLIPANAQNIISADIKQAIQPVIDAGLINESNLSIVITTRDSTVFAQISYTDPMTGVKMQPVFSL
jgi:hypothetical protein